MRDSRWEVGDPKVGDPKVGDRKVGDRKWKKGLGG